MNYMLNLNEAKKSDIKKLRGLIVQVLSHIIKKKYHDKNYLDQKKWTNEIKTFENDLLKKVKQLSTKQKIDIPIKGKLYDDIIKDVRGILNGYVACDTVTTKNIDDMLRYTLIPNINRKGGLLFVENILMRIKSLRHNLEVL